MKAEKGKLVKIEYTGTFDDGTVFDASEKHGKPLEFVVGAGQVVPGFDKAVEGMLVDEEKEVTILPEDGYGTINAELVKKVPRDQLPEGPEPQVGMTLGVGLPNGQQIPATITAVSETDVTIDLNHPLAGKTLHFKIKVVGVSDAPKADEHSGEGHKCENC